MLSMQGGELGNQPFRHSTLTFLMPIHLFISAKPSKVQKVFADFFPLTKKKKKYLLKTLIYLLVKLLPYWVPALTPKDETSQVSGKFLEINLSSALSTTENSGPYVCTRETSAWILTLISPTLTALEAHLTSAASQVAARLKLCKNLPRILLVDLKVQQQSSH